MLGEKKREKNWSRLPTFKNLRSRRRSSNTVAQFERRRAVRTPSRSSNAVAQFEHRRAVRTPSRSSITVAQFERRRAVPSPSRSSNAVAQFERRRAVPSSSRSLNAVAQFHHRRAVRTPSTAGDFRPARPPARPRNLKSRSSFSCSATLNYCKQQRPSPQQIHLHCFHIKLHLPSPLPQQTGKKHSVALHQNFFFLLKFFLNT